MNYDRERLPESRRSLEKRRFCIGNPSPFYEGAPHELALHPALPTKPSFEGTLTTLVASWLAFKLALP